MLLGRLPAGIQLAAALVTLGAVSVAAFLWTWLTGALPFLAALGLAIVLVSLFGALVWATAHRFRGQGDRPVFRAVLVDLLSDCQELHDSDIPLGVSPPWLA